MSRLTELYFSLGDLGRAEEFIMRGLASNRDLGDLYILPIRLARAAEIKIRLGKLSEASALLAEATDLAEAMLVNASTIGLKTTVIGSLNELYVSHFKLLINDVPSAYRVIEEARTRVIAEATRRRV